MAILIPQGRSCLSMKPTHRAVWGNEVEQAPDNIVGASVSSPA